MKRTTRAKLIKLIKGERKKSVLYNDFWRFELMPKSFTSDKNTLKVYYKNQHIGDIVESYIEAENRYDNYIFVCSHAFLKRCEKYQLVVQRHIKRPFLDEVVTIIDFTMVTACKLVSHYEYAERGEKKYPTNYKEQKKGA